MAIRPTTQNDLILVHRTGLIVQVVQAILGIFLLRNNFNSTAFWLLTVTTLGTLAVCHFGWQYRPLRVLTRVSTAVPLLFVVLFLTTVVLTWNDRTSLQDMLIGISCTGNMVLSLYGISTALAAVKGGVYDKMVACFTTVCLLAVAILAMSINYKLDWSWDNNIVRYVWLAVVAAATVMTWLCAFLRVPTTKKDAN